jgi:hypothetical protein
MCPFGVAKGGFFLRKKPLESNAFEEQPLSNRYRREDTPFTPLRASGIYEFFGSIPQMLFTIHTAQKPTAWTPPPDEPQQLSPIFSRPRRTKPSAVQALALLCPVKLVNEVFRASLRLIHPTHIARCGS